MLKRNLSGLGYLRDYGKKWGKVLKARNLNSVILTDASRKYFMLIFGMFFSCGIRDPYLYRMTTWLSQFSFQFGLITNASDDVLGKEQGCKGRGIVKFVWEASRSDGSRISPAQIWARSTGYFRRRHNVTLKIRSDTN